MADPRLQDFSNISNYCVLTPIFKDEMGSRVKHRRTREIEGQFELREAAPAYSADFLVQKQRFKPQKGLFSGRNLLLIRELRWSDPAKCQTRIME